MTAKDQFDALEKRVKDFAEIEVPMLIEEKTIEAVMRQLEGTPLEPLARGLKSQAEIFPPDKTGLVKVDVAIGAIEMARVLFESKFIMGQVEFAGWQTQAGTLEIIGQAAKGLWKAFESLSAADFAKSVWQFITHFAASMTAILYGPAALEFSLAIGELIFNLRSLRLFQQRAKRAWVKARTRD